MKTILALLFATGLLVLAQEPPPANSARPTMPAFPLPNVRIPTNIDDATRQKLIEALRQRMAEVTNNAAATDRSNSVAPAASTFPQPIPSTPLLTTPAPATGTNALAGAANSPATPGAIPAPGDVAPATGNARSANATTALVGAPEPAEYQCSFPAVDMDVMLEEYSKLVNRTILRPSALPGGKMTLVTQSPLTRTEAIQAFDAVFALNGITTIPWQEKFVKVVLSSMTRAEVKPFSTLDSTNVPETAEYICQVVRLQYALPSQMMQLLQPYSKIPNSIQAIDSSGLLIICDLSENVKRMMELIEKVDTTAVKGTIDPVVIPIKYALATDIANVLSSLSSGGGGGGAVNRPPSGLSGTSRMGGGRRGGVSSTMGGAYQQGGLAPGSPLGAAQLGARAGQPGVVPPGQTFAQRLQNIVNNVANAGEFQIIGEAKIIPDERTNTLLVFAGHEDLEMITNIVSKLDVELAQVLIEAIIMEVSLSDSKTFGVSAQQKPRRFSDILTSAGGGMNNGQSFSNIIGGGLPSGFSYAGALGPSWDVAIQAIANDSSINVLSAPRIMTFNYAEAHIFVGQSVPVISSSYYGLGTSGSSANYQFQDVGIDLDVKPLINQDGLVIMDITQSVNALGPNYTINGDQVPSQIKRDAEAKVAVRNGETILLGGFISSTINKSESGVPFLKDIPILGNLFKQHSKSKDRVELVVLIRPTVLSTADAAAKAATLETSKLPGVSAAKKAFEQENAERLRQVGQPSTVSKLK